MDFETGDEFNEFEAELKALKERISTVEAENGKMKDIIIEHGLEEELEGIDFISVEELICVDGIRHIAMLVRDQDYSDRDIKNYDILLKNLRQIRGKNDSMVKPTKKESTAELLKIVGSLDEK
jgi:transcriptional regulatory protein LevR|tara:strand:- start:5776 stop:6144 length:369 start_codon:yes stop_codon:yes gene_type:complete